MEGARKFIVLAAVIAAGCHGPADVSYPTVASEPSPYVPNAGSGNAFDAYVLAAGEAEQAVAGMKSDPIHRTFFVPDQREAILKALGPALRRIGAATSPCDFKFVPARPGAPVPYRAAWRLLGRAFRWQIDDQMATSTPEAAIPTAAVGFRFAGDLCGGGPSDRTLGVEIANDLREALVPALTKLKPSDLHRLADAVKGGLIRRPALPKTFEHGDAEMALALQTFMDGYRKEDLAAFKVAMGREFSDLDTALKDLKKKAPGKQAEFFNALNADRQRLSQAWTAAAALPASRRADLLSIKLTGERPRRAFARHFFLIGKPLLEIEDRSVAQLRLFVLECELRRTALDQKRAPADLSKVSAPWSTDPYNGRIFGYLPDGAEFRVYSVGSNLKDDLGDTDGAGLNPDIRTVLPN